MAVSKVDSKEKTSLKKTNEGSRANVFMSTSDMLVAYQYNSHIVSKQQMSYGKIYPPKLYREEQSQGQGKRGDRY